MLETKIVFVIITCMIIFDGQNTEADCHVDVVEAPEDATYLSKDQQTYYAPSTRPSRPKVPALRYKKPSKLPAVEVAKPGASYRPTFEVNGNV